MTKQTKIPVPEQEKPKADSATLIERVVRNYDLVKLAPAPIPENLIPPVSKRRKYRRADDAIEDAVTSPVEPEAPAAKPEPVKPAPAAPVAEAPVEAVRPEPRPEVVEPEVIAPVRNVPAPVAVPVRFKGERHPVNRQHLREQGLIVPEGSVTALLEEFRIVKRQLLYNASQLAQHGLGPAAQRILICSPHPGEGKSFTSVNLALAIAAEKESEVLLVDADFAKPS
ncbi:MAG TPA: capsular biosynthesis protein, partial [Novosphingobium sp.]|nr:capsular biosynthesis protein [Novosphingobium sp.]